MKCDLVVMGDVLRDHVRNKSHIGKRIAECQRRGKLADDNLVSQALMLHLETLLQNYSSDDNKFGDGNDDFTKVGFILDGFPRTLRQAKNMLMWPEKLQLSFAINIEVPDSICLSKMLGRRKCTVCKESFNLSDINTNDGFLMPPKLPSPYPCGRCDENKDWERRVDDTEEIIAKRIEEFHEKSAPVSQFFFTRDELVNFVPYNGVSDIGKMENLVKEQMQQQRVPKVQR